MILEVVSSSNLKGRLEVPGDKSISHRAAILGALAEGRSTIENFSSAADCASTVSCLEELGTVFEKAGGTLAVAGVGESGFASPAGELDAGNSGTTMRLLTGAAAGMDVEFTISGDDSLVARPMKRIIEPLGLMGAKVESLGGGGRPPLRVGGAKLQGIEYGPDVASAQVKSAVLLAGLRADGPTTVNERYRTRDHTERMLILCGITVGLDGLSVTVEPGTPGRFECSVPGDISSAAFLIGAALVTEGSDVTIHSVGLNPTRMAFLSVLEKMGADIDVREADGGWEPVGEITARSGGLTAVELGEEEVASIIDEVPLVALLATQADGRTEIRGAGELRHKESDRIRATVDCLTVLGADMEEHEDGMTINGPSPLVGAEIDPVGDHRLAMVGAVAGLCASGTTTVRGWECSTVSFPGFAGVLDSIGAAVRER